MHYPDDNNLLSLTISNSSDVDFQLLNRSDYTFSRDSNLVVVEQHSSHRLVVKTGDRLERIQLQFEVQNALTAPRRAATVDFDLVIK